jgi:purine-binding chemotaxis protein CheW
MAGATQICTFTVDDLMLGVEVTQVQEVIRSQPMTRVPLASRVIHGLINLRGQIVSAVDLRTRMGLPPREGDGPPMHVVIRGVEGSVSLLVDAIGDVIEVPEDALEAPPATLHASLREVTDAVCKLPGQLLLLIDPERATGVTPVEPSTRTPGRRSRDAERLS